MDGSKGRAHPITRRAFVGGVTLGAAAVVLGCEGTMTGTEAEDAGRSARTDGGPAPGGDAAASGAPVWSSLPTIVFVAGVASTFSIAEYVSDPDGDELAITLNDVPLPAGVTFDAAGKQLVYDGSGPVAMTSGHVLTADDGT